MTTSLPLTQASTPNPSIQTLVFTLLRAVLALAGALGIGIGANISDGVLITISGIVVVIGTTIWSFWEKFSAAKAAHQAATVSATSGIPSKPV